MEERLAHQSMRGGGKPDGEIGPDHFGWGDGLTQDIFVPGGDALSLD